MAKGLTRRQAAVLDFIVGSIQEMGYPPTIAEIGEHFQITSTNGVNDHLVALERKGFIKRSSKARSIQLTDRAASPTNVLNLEAAFLPLVGRVAAGYPILAQENIEDHIPVSNGLAREGAYCLTVQGESMIEDGILDGDVIIVDPSIRPREGDIVVALVDEDDATVKRWYKRGDMVELRPSNPAMQPMLMPANQIALQGVVVGLQRRLR